MGQPQSLSNPTRFSRSANGPPERLDIASLEQSVQSYCHQALAQSTKCTYSVPVSIFLNFCDTYHIIDPLPVSETLLCSYTAFLGNQGLAPQSIHTYLSALHTFQVLLGYPDPRDVNSLPRLRMVITGICRTRSLNACQDSGSLSLLRSFCGSIVYGRQQAGTTNVGCYGLPLLSVFRVLSVW